MAKYGSSQVTITLDDSTGTPRIITGFVLTMGGLKITQNTQVDTAYGSSWESTLVTGIRKGAAIALGGIYDDTALVGSAAVLAVTDADAVPGFTRTLVVALGGGHTYTAEVILTEGGVTPKTGNLHDFDGSLLPTGSIVIT